MKKIAVLSLVFVLLLSLFACDEKNNDADTTSSNTEVAESQTESEADVSKDESEADVSEDESEADVSEDESETDVSKDESEENPVLLDKLQQFEQGLTEKEINFEKREMDAEAFGAKEGYVYLIGDLTPVFLYRFDKDSEAYKDAVKNNQIKFGTVGLTYDVVFSDDVCIVVPLSISDVTIIAYIETIFGSVTIKSEADVSEDESEADVSQEESEENPALLYKFQQFEQGLTEKEINFEKGEVDAKLYGAEKSYLYIFDDGSAVQLYLFDKDSSAYKVAVNKNELQTSWISAISQAKPVVFNDDICIYFHGTPTAKTEIEAIFNNIK